MDYDRMYDEILPEYHVWMVYDIVNCSVATGKVKFPYNMYERELYKGNI